MRRLQIGATIAAVMVVASAPWRMQAESAGQAQSGQAIIASLSEPGEGLAIASTSRETGHATFAASRGQGVLLPVAATDTAADRASMFIDLYGSAFGLQDRTEVRLAQPPQRDALGAEHVRFQQLHHGVPVTGGEFIVHLKGARVMAANGRVLARLPADVRARTLPVGATDTARQVIAKLHPGRAAGVRYSEPRLEVFSRGFLEHRPDDSRLAWFVEATGDLLREYIWVDARTGGLLLNFSQLQSAKFRQIYNANNGSVMPGTLARQEGDPPTGNADVDQAYTFSGQTYDYFFTNFGRDSFDAIGGAVVSTVNWNGGPSTCPNAFWNGTQLVFCLGLTSADDIVAHEWTHGLSEREVNFFMFVQSGALNESYSDVFGETIDLTNVTAADTPAVRWQLGEDLPVGALRDMMNPNTHNDPARMSDTTYFYCDTANDDHGGVHSNSGVPNHAYALMVDGGTYNGRTITGIGLAKAGRIQYRALTTYLTGSSGFLDNFNALNQSCSDLVGTVGITSADCAQVHQALLAVEMNAPWGCMYPQPLTQPSVCPAGGTPSNLLTEDFETGLPGWTVDSTTAAAWTFQTFYVHDGARSGHGPDPAFISDHRLNTPVAGVSLPANARLIFTHAYEFENLLGAAHDGGVLEYSTNGGGTWLDAGGLIDSGLAYNGTVGNTLGNPLGGRSAFTFASFGYQKTRLNLASLAAQTVRFRWRMGSDSSVAGAGWFLDNVAIYSCAVTAGAPVITVQPAPQTVGVGATATFTVAATGNATLRYQWLKNNSPIAGATTNTLQVPNVHFQDFGFYSVIVSNSVGTATSDAASLMINAPSGGAPSFSKQPLNTTATVGQTAIFNAEILFEGTFQWEVSTDGGTVWNPVVNGGVYGGATTKALTITGVTLSLNNYLYRVIATNAGFSSTSDVARLNVVAANFITNGTFSSGTTGWSLFATPDMSYMEQAVVGGVFEYNRVPPPPGTTNQAVIFQNTGVAVNGGALAAQFDIGNSSSQRRRMSVLIIDADFSDLSVCTFWLAPSAPMRTYRMRTHPTKSWTNAAIYFYAATAGTAATTGGSYRLDNVSLGANAAGSNVRTDCEDPTSPAPPGGADGPNLLTNGDFSTGTIAPWTLFGTITGQVTAGVFDFVKPTATAPAGVILQATGVAIVVNQFMTATFDLGNSSSVRKRVTAIVHDNDFSDLAACTFWLPAGLPLSTFQVRMRATEAWTDATLSIYPATVGAEQWLRLDNASLRRTPGATMLGTECLEPVEVVPPGLAGSGGAGSGGRTAQAAPPAAAFRSPAASSQPSASRASDVRTASDVGLPEWTSTSDNARRSRTLRWQRPIDLDGVADGRLSFWSLVAGGEGSAEVQVSVDGLTWRTLAVVPPDGDWTEVDVDLSEFAGQTLYLQFVYAPAADEPQGAWRVANVRVRK